MYCEIFTSSNLILIDKIYCITMQLNHKLNYHTCAQYRIHLVHIGQVLCWRECGLVSDLKLKLKKPYIEVHFNTPKRQRWSIDIYFVFHLKVFKVETGEGWRPVFSSVMCDYYSYYIPNCNLLMKMGAIVEVCRSTLSNACLQKTQEAEEEGKRWQSNHERHKRR